MPSRWNKGKEKQEQKDVVEKEPRERRKTTILTRFHQENSKEENKADIEDFEPEDSANQTGKNSALSPAKFITARH